MAEGKRRSPYQGLVPFSEEDWAFFFGREKDTRLITANLFASPLTLLYGESGVGKTSVLRAGVVHQLRQRNDLLVVPFSTWQGEPVGTLKAVVAREAALVRAENLPSDSLPLADYLADCATRLDRRLMIILDQFEEYSLYHPRDDRFALEFPSAVARADLPVSFIISIREDSLAKLDRFEGRIPVLFDNYLRIEHLDRASARAAIEEPLGQHNRSYATGGHQVTIEPALVEAVLDQVKTGKLVLGEAARGIGRIEASVPPAEVSIETPYLQLVMTHLWDEEAKATSTRLRLETLDRLGGAERIVRTHLDGAMSALPPDERKAAAGVFRYLVTPSGTKIAYTLSDVAYLAGLPTNQLEPVLEKLSGADVRILRPVPPPPGQPTALRYEIFHDVLASAVLDWRARYQRDQEGAERDEREKILAKKRAEAERQARKFRRLNWALAALLLLSFAAVIFAFWQRSEARAKAALAKESEAKAQWEFKRAEEEKVHASNAAGDARQSESNMLQAKNEAEAASKIARQSEAIARVRQLVTTSILVEGVDPELSVMVAANAVAATWRQANAVLPEAEQQLHRAIMASHVRLTLVGDIASVISVAWSPDGKRLATGDSGESAKVWDTETGKELLTLRGLRGFVYSVAWSPDGKRLATSDDETAKVWDAGTGKELLTLRGHGGFVYSVAWSPDGKRLATGSYDQTAKVWDAGTGKELLTLLGHSTHVFTVAWSPDGKRLATGSADNTAKVWDVGTGKELLALHGHDDGVTSVAWSPDGKRLATGSHDRTAKVWDAETSKALLTLHGHDDGVTSVAWSPEGKRLATGSDDQTAKVWDAGTGKELLTLRGHSSSLNMVAWSPDGERLATGGNDQAKVWDAGTDKELLTLHGHSGSVNMMVAWSPAGKRLTTWSPPSEMDQAIDRTAKVWDAATGKELLTLNGHSSSINSVAWSPDGKRLATGSRDQTAKVWGAETGKELLTLRGHHDAVRSVAWSADGRRLATASGDRTAKVWDAVTGKELLTLRGHDDAVRSVAWSADGRRLATASGDRTAKVWDAGTGKELLTLRGLDEDVVSVAWSPDGKRLAAGSDDQTAKVWDAGTGKELLTLRGHSSHVYSVAWSPDGKRLTTGSQDKTAKAWDAGTGKELLTLRGHSDYVTSVTWSPDGRRLATGSGDHTVQVYAMDIRDLMELARQHITAKPSEEGCKEYLHVDRCPPFPSFLDAR